MARPLCITHLIHSRIPPALSSPKTLHLKNLSLPFLSPFENFHGTIEKNKARNGTREFIHVLNT